MSFLQKVKPRSFLNRIKAAADTSHLTAEELYHYLTWVQGLTGDLKGDKTLEDIGDRDWYDLKISSQEETRLKELAEHVQDLQPLAGHRNTWSLEEWEEAEDGRKAHEDWKKEVEDYHKKLVTSSFLTKIKVKAEPAPNLNIFHGGLEAAYKGILDTQGGFRKMDQELRKIKSPEAKPLLDEFDSMQTQVNLLVSKVKDLRETIGKQIETGEGFSKGLGRGVGTRVRQGRTPGGKRA